MNSSQYRTDYKYGYIVEYNKPCFESWLLIPGGNLWNPGLRGFLYILAMFYFFLGIAIVADIFMSCIEVITSKKRKVTRYDPERQESVEIEVFVWNETVANLTLMALGSSAPEILLAVIETVQELGRDSSSSDQDGLGTFTIIGSASFNMLLITSICVVSVPSGTVKIVREFGVFILTSIWSLFAYIWLLVALKWSSPEVVEVWEAFLTLAFFPLLVLTSWCQDHGWWCRSSKVLSVEPPEVRVVGMLERPSSHLMVHRSMELRVIEQHRISVGEHDFKEIPKSKSKLREVVSLWKGQKPDANCNDTVESLAHAIKHFKDAQAAPEHSTAARVRFRHAALTSITVGRHRKPSLFVDRDRDEGKKQMNAFAKTFVGSKLSGTPTNEQPGKRFNFGAQSYSVVKSAKHIDIDILLTKPRKRVSQASSPQFQMSTLPAPYDPSTQIDESINTKQNHRNGNVVNGSAKPSRKEAVYTRTSSPSDSEQSYPVSASHRESLISLPEEAFYSVDYETRDATAKQGRDYCSTKGTMTFQAGITKHILRIPIMLHDDFSKNREFYVILKNPSPQNSVELGESSLTRITIIDDDEPGEFDFEQASYHANFMTQDVTCTVLRRKGCDGHVTIKYRTLNGTAVGGPPDEDDRITSDFEEVNDGCLTFQHGETSKMINIRINPESDKKNFILLLQEPSPGASLGDKTAAVIHISSDVDEIVDRVANIITLEDQNQSLGKTWRMQFEEAIVIQGEEDEEGNIQPLSALDLTLHLLTMFWKVLFAFIPPRPFLGGWAAFVVSLLFIAGLTAVVEQLGKLLGCVVGLKNSVTGITIIAIGTSLPDTFASKTAALQDTGADAAIGNITGSNSVNVFLGLGLPWVISVCYHAAKGTTYRVSANNLSFSVLVYTLCGGICIILLVLRRVFLKGELGGTATQKWLTGLFLVFLWFVYVILSSLMAYDYIPNTI